jgi:hypothetical protein
MCVLISPSASLFTLTLSRELITFDALYLGYVRVNKKEGSKVRTAHVKFVNVQHCRS